MATAAELALIITGKNEASKVLKDVKDDAGGLGKVLGDVGKIAGGFLAANVVAGAGEKVLGFLNDSVGAARESLAANAQLDAVLKSTGGTAGFTADQLRDHASALEKTSLFEDEAVIGAQSLLLTFTNIKGKLPDATQTVLDMSQALGQDTKSSAVQLGKALNDPINGITALSRVGVSFTEQQKEQIRTMQEAGDIEGAQALILAELNKEFGGSAKAASDAAGKQEVLRDRMNDLKETIGEKMLPVQEKLHEAQLLLVSVIADKVIPLLEEWYVKHWPAVRAAIDQVVGFIKEHWPEISAVFQFVFDFVKARIEGFIQAAGAIIEIVTSVVEFVKAIFRGDWSRAWEEMKDIAVAMVDLAIGWVKSQFGNLPGIILGFAGDLAKAGLGLGKSLADGLADAVRDGLNWVIGKINDFISGISGKTIIPSVDLGPLGSSPRFGVPDIGFRVPVLDSGGIVTRPTLALLAANSKPEAVVPLDKAGMGGINLHLTVNGNVFAQDLPRLMLDALKEAVRSGELRGLVAPA